MESADGGCYQYKDGVETEWVYYYTLFYEAVQKYPELDHHFAYSDEFGRYLDHEIEAVICTWSIVVSPSVLILRLL